MIEIIAIVVVLWLLGIIQIPWLSVPSLPSLTILGYQVTSQRLLLIVILAWLAMQVGSPLRQIIWVFGVLWLLSVFGVIVVGGMGSLLVISMVAGLVLSQMQK